MGYEIRRIFEIFKRYRIKFVFVWLAAVVFSLVFYFILPEGYKTDSKIIMEKTRQPWPGFKRGALPSRHPLPEGVREQTISLRDPFWNFLYDQMEESTYDFTPFFHARTTVFRIIDDLGCRQHFDNGAMTPDEIVLAFTQNLDVSFDRVAGEYNISYTFVDPTIAREIVNRYTFLFTEFINSLSYQNNYEPTLAVTRNIERIEKELAEIEIRQADLKSSSGIIAPAEFMANLSTHLYQLDSKLIQAESRAKASMELIVDSRRRVETMESYGLGESDEFSYSVIELMADPMIVVILARIFWDSINLAQAEMTYVEGTPQLEHWSERVEISKRLLMRRMAENEKANLAELVATFTAESAKATWLKQHKKESQDKLDSLPGIESEFVYLQRQKVSKIAMLTQLRDLREIGESYTEKGDKVAAILDSAYLPNKKSDPNFLKLLLASLFTSTILAFGWFFVRENIEVHDGVG
ncbi:hypothetical protein KKB99_08600 [bacterium]|nr:hypothetical protein [bacterium]MBU1026050.1 hypothetical protein [bacterium]